MLTLGKLKKALTYDPATGFFTRNKGGPGVSAGSLAGGMNQDGYIRIGIHGKKYMAHRLAWLWVYGSLPSGELDHVNNSPADNRIANLRKADRSKNCANRVCRKTSATGVKGVSRQNGKFVASSGGKYLGIYATIQEAHAAYTAAAKTLYGEFARIS